jgi:hypothetical protein
MPHITGPRLVAALVGGVVALQALMLFAFAWPAANSGPREVPIAVAGPPESLQQIAALVGTAPSRDEGVPAIEPVQFADAAAATTAITEREVYGAIVVGPDGAEVLVASAASPAVAQFLRSAALELSQEGGVPIAFTDVVPTSADDPTGAGLAAGVLPLVMTSAAGGFAAALALRRWAPRLTVVAGLAVAGGLASAAILQYGLGVTAGSYWSLAGVLMLLIGAVSAAVAGLGSVFGRAGAVLGALLVIFLGNPLSAAPSAPEFLPQPWGELGQLLPPGAGVTAVRSVAFFDGAAVGTPVLVLSAWAFIGLALIVLGGLVGRSGPAPASAGGSGSVPDRGTYQARSGTSA